MPTEPESPGVDAVVFDLDGVLTDTEPFWESARRRLVAAEGDGWDDERAGEMLGMSGPEWSRFLNEAFGVALDPMVIRVRVVADVVDHVGRGLAPLPGAVDAVRAMAGRWPIALATSADRDVVDAVLDAIGLAWTFDVIVTSDEAGRGKPAPDVFLAATERLGVHAERTVGIEDSPNGMRAVIAAGLALVAIPSAAAANARDVIELADVELESIEQLTPEVVQRAAMHGAARKGSDQ